MKKAMEFWIFREDIKLMNLHHHVIGPNGVHLKEDSTALERPEEWIHVKEVLDPDPKDEVIKIMREALEIYANEANWIIKKPNPGMNHEPQSQEFRHHGDIEFVFPEGEPPYTIKFYEESRWRGGTIAREALAAAEKLEK